MIPIIIFFVLHYSYINIYIIIAITALLLRERQRECQKHAQREGGGRKGEGEKDRQTETERQRQETEMVTDLENMDLTLRESPVVVLSPCLAQKKSSSSICQIELLKHLGVSMEILL